VELTVNKFKDKFKADNISREDKGSKEIMPAREHPVRSR
jgi:hypothetical protein